MVSNLSPFRVRKNAASLKRQWLLLDELAMKSFRVRKNAASLKRCRSSEALGPIEHFPRSQERGLIEATPKQTATVAANLLSAFARTRPH